MCGRKEKKKTRAELTVSLNTLLIEIKFVIIIASLNTNICETKTPTLDAKCIENKR